MLGYRVFRISGEFASYSLPLGMNVGSMEIDSLAYTGTEFAYRLLSKLLVLGRSSASYLRYSIRARCIRINQYHLPPVRTAGGAVEPLSVIVRGGCSTSRHIPGVICKAGARVGFSKRPSLSSPGEIVR